MYFSHFPLAVIPSWNKQTKKETFRLAEYVCQAGDCVSPSFRSSRSFSHTLEWVCKQGCLQFPDGRDRVWARTLGWGNKAALETWPNRGHIQMWLGIGGGHSQDRQEGTAFRGQEISLPVLSWNTMVSKSRAGTQPCTNSGELFQAEVIPKACSEPAGGLLPTGSPSAPADIKEPVPLAGAAGQKGGWRTSLLIHPRQSLARLQSAGDCQPQITYFPFASVPLPPAPPEGLHCTP